MSTVGLVFAVLAVIFAFAALTVAWCLWQQLKAVHQRLHRFDQSQLVLERNLAVVSRGTVRAVAAQLTGSPIANIQASAQHGEELFLWQALDMQPNGVAIEIGAYDGQNLSNSLFFQSIGWKTILVEAHPELAERCRASRPDAIVIHAALGETNGETTEFSMVRGPKGMDTLSCVGKPSAGHQHRIVSQGGHIETVSVPARTLDSILNEYNVDTIDCMSVDVEGAELAVLAAADLSVNRPRVIVVEDNSGGRDQAVANLLQSHNYTSIGTVGCNVIYRLVEAE